MPMTARAIPTPRAALEPVDMPDEFAAPALLREGDVGSEVAGFEDAPGWAGAVSEGDEGDVDEEDLLEAVSLATKFQPLIWTPAIFVEPKIVLV